MTRLDWSKGYTVDPARAQREDFLAPDPVAKKPGLKKKPSSSKMTSAKKLAKKARKKAKREAVKASPRPQGQQASTPKMASGRPVSLITRKQLFASLGLPDEPKQGMKPKERGAILKDLLAEGILLNTGQPNPEHPKVVAIGMTIAKGRGTARSNNTNVSSPEGSTKRALPKNW